LTPGFCLSRMDGTPFVFTVYLISSVYCDISRAWVSGEFSFVFLNSGA
jgi:hypothetical protein